jgi:tartronate-semialdehyde synthase
MTMAKMRAIEAAVQVMLKDGVTAAFGLPGAAINPLYAAMRKIGGIDHVLARHVEGASHMTEGYTRAKAGNIGVCIGTSGPAGTDMITGLYSASADFIPILCITGQAPRVRLYKEDFQAVDIESIANPVTKWAVTVREPAQVPRAFQQAFHLMRSGRPGPVASRPCASRPQTTRNRHSLPGVSSGYPDEWPWLAAASVRPLCSTRRYGCSWPDSRL